ncbi:MAG: NAD(P)-binding domain-containing protein [Rhodothermales bacterium]|nr:NAD(P)-binding domain-containing protein [Rhodothermales bacterium]
MGIEVESIVVWLIGIGLVFVFVVPYLIAHVLKEQHAERVYNKAREMGVEEPDTLHPVINPTACICTGNCIAVCPEKDVLGLLGGMALAINPTHCVGHGLCERACPVDAIQLVVGTSKRGVDIPRIKENFETNVEGLFILGELGGMGLLRNAFEQARQCMRWIAAQPDRSTDPNVLDVIIVGCGPAGLAASLHAHSLGLPFRTIEKEDIGGTVRYYPRKKLVMTFPLDVPGYGKLDFKSILKEDLIQLWSSIVERTGIAGKILTGVTLQNVRKMDQGCFEVTTSGDTFQARRVILAIGRRGVPRKLDVPGEDTSKVAYSLLDPDHFHHNRVLVVGGGDSAIEAACALAAQPGNTVHLSYRRSSFARIKPGNTRRIEEAIATHKVHFLPETEVTHIGPDSVAYRDAGGGMHRIANDYVFVMVGGTLPTSMLKDLGIQIDTKFGQPLIG